MFSPIQKGLCTHIALVIVHPIGDATLFNVHFLRQDPPLAIILS